MTPEENGCLKDGGVSVGEVDEEEEMEAAGRRQTQGGLIPSLKLARVFELRYRQIGSPHQFELGCYQHIFTTTSIRY